MYSKPERTDVALTSYKSLEIVSPSEFIVERDRFPEVQVSQIGTAED